MKKLALFGAMLALPLAANAHNYNYAEIHYHDGDMESPGGVSDTRSYSVHLKRTLGEMLFLDAGASNTILLEAKEQSIDLLTLGLGLQGQVTEAISGYGVLSLDRLSTVFSEGGYGLAVGMRAEVSDTVEVNVSYKHTEFTDDIDIGAWGLSGVFAISDRCAVSLGYEDSKADGLGTHGLEFDGFKLGMRLYY